MRLTCEEREQLDALIYSGKSSAQLLTRARILLKVDVSEAGDGWSDSAICAALDTSINNVARARRQLVEEDFEATLKRKYNPNSARPRIFDGAAEAKLIALTCSPAPEGFARWSLRLLEEKVVELDIVEKASDNTIGRTVNNHRLKPVASGYGYKPDLVEPRGSTAANAVNFVPFPVSLTKLETCTPSKSEGSYSVLC